MSIFANPSWLWALLALLPILVLRIWGHMTSRRSLEGLVAPRLYQVLVSGASQLRPWLSFSFFILGMTGIILALARPRMGFEEIETTTEGRSIMIAIDTSKSMLATDLQPNRLERAKMAARDIVESMKEDQIGLIAFAGKAFVQAPLTNDHEAVIESIEQIDTEIIPRGGTNITSAVMLAMKSFAEEDSDQDALVIFSDGEALEGHAEVEAIKRKAKEENMVIISIGVGTENGSIIPIPGRSGDFLKDNNGEFVRSRLDASALKGLAANGGIYLQLGDRTTMTAIVRRITSNLAATHREQKIERRPIERFMWPLGFGLFFLICSHVVHLLLRSKEPVRRAAPDLPDPKKKVKAAVSAGLFLIFPATGFVGAQDGWDFIERENFISAIDKFESELNVEGELSEKERTQIQLGLGSAAYRMGDYEKASEAYGAALVRDNRKTREQAHYNLGNTLYRIGETRLSPRKKNQSPHTPVEMARDPERIEAAIRQWLGAIEHYEAVLRINQRNPSARHNIEVIKKRLEGLRQPPPEQPDQPPQPESENENEKEEKSDSEKEEEQKNQNGQNQNEGDGQNSNDSENENEAGEKPDSEPKENGEGQPEEPRPPEEEPGDGELEADPSTAEPPPSRPNQDLTNPETGYSPSVARQLIESLADEDGELRPVFPRSYQPENYKDW